MILNKISINHYLILSATLFSISIAGLILNRKNIISILMSIELIILAVNINFVAFSVYVRNPIGQIFSLIILSVSAAEISIGLAILVLYFRNSNSIDIKNINNLKN